MKCQNLFSGKNNKKNISICPQLKDLPGMLRVNLYHSLGNFSRQHTKTFVLFFPENRTFHANLQIGQFA